MTVNQSRVASQKLALGVSLGFVVVGSIAVRWLEHSRLHHRWHQDAKWETLVGGGLAAVVVAAVFAWVGSRLLNRTIGTLMAAASGGLAMAASGPVPGILLGALTGCVVTRGWGWLALRFLFRTSWVAAGGALSAALIHRVWQGASESSPGVLWATFALLGALQLVAAVSPRRGRGERMPGTDTRFRAVGLYAILTMPVLPASWLLGWHVDRHLQLQELVDQRAGEIRFISARNWRWSRPWDGSPARVADLKEATPRDLCALSELSVLRELRVDGFRGDDGVLLGALRRSSGLRRLQLVGAPRLRDSIVPILGLPGLQRCLVDDRRGRRVVVAATTQVRLSGASITDEDLRWLLRLPRVESLSVVDCPRITRAGLEVLAGLQIHRLELAGTSITDGDLMPLTRLPLQSLVLRCPRITAAGVSVFARLPTLKTFDLDDTDIDEAMLRTVSALPAQRLVLGGETFEPGALRWLRNMRLQTCALDAPLELAQIEPVCQIDGLRQLSFISPRFDLRLIAGLRRLGRDYPIRLEVAIADDNWLKQATASALSGASFAADLRLFHDRAEGEGFSQVCLYQPTNRWQTPGRADHAVPPTHDRNPHRVSDPSEYDRERWRGRLRTEQRAIGAPFLNDVGMALIPIPAGRFLMGFDGAQVIGAPQKTSPRHWVTLTEPFYMGAMEVTQGQFHKVMGERRGTFLGAQLPVETVSWEEASRFCRQLSQRPAERAAKRRYRLPTEAEWEYACRAGSDSEYAFGDRLEELDRYAWHAFNAGGRSHVVGQKEPNAWGLFDMHGNVYEWVQDWYHDDYYALSPPADPPGPSDGVVRVVRGGGWAFGGYRSAFRAFGGSGHSSKFVGFRVACEIPDHR